MSTAHPLEIAAASVVAVTENPTRCRENHKHYAKISIDSGLLITTLIQLRLVLRADKDSYPLLTYILIGLISLSIILQFLVMFLYIFVHHFKSRSDFNDTKLAISQMIFVITCLNSVTAVLMEALLEPKY